MDTKSRNFVAQATKLAGAVDAADKGWSALNKDDRAIKLAQAAKNKAVARLTSENPAEVLSQRLEVLGAFADDIEQENPEAPEPSQWRARATQLRRRLPLVEAMPAKDRKRNFKILLDDANKLLEAAGRFGEPSASPESEKSRLPRVVRRSRRMEADTLDAADSSNLEAGAADPEITAGSGSPEHV